MSASLPPPILVAGMAANATIYAPASGPGRSSALTTEQKMLQLQLIQRQYAHHSDSAHSQQAAQLAAAGNSNVPPTSLESLVTMENNTGVDLAAITTKALTKAHHKRRPPNAHVQHYDEDTATSYDATLTPRTLFDRKRKTISRLTITLIMQLNIDQIRAIRHDFDDFSEGVNMSQFVHIMTKHVYSPSLSFCPSPSLFLQSLIELFESMDLDGDQSLEWEELLSTIVHMGMGATDHLVLSPINLYRDGPQYFTSKQPNDRYVAYHPTLQKLIYYEKDDFVFRLYDPSMRQPVIQPRIGQNSVLCCEYISQYGKMDEMKIGGEETKTEKNKSKSSAHATNDSASVSSASESKSNIDHSASTSANNKIVVSYSRKEEAEKKKADSFSFYKHALLFTNNNKKSQRSNTNNSSNNQTYSHNHSNRTNKGFGGGQWVTDPHSEDVYYTVKERSTGHRFGNDDLLVTATAQYLSLWEGLPNGDPLLCDSKKVKSPYSALHWCPVTQRLFTGDVHGSVQSWKIVNSIPVEQLSHNNGNTGAASSGGAYHYNKLSSLSRLQTVPKLVKEKTFHGHRDVITKIVTIPSMTFVLTSSLDHSVRMWDINTGNEKNVFLAHRAGVIDLTYSNEYRFLLSASIDHDVCVWSPFAEHVVFKLIGHTSPLIGVQFVSGTPQIITADCDGWIKVWDARNFTCCQTWMSMPSMCAFTHTGDRHARIMVVGRSSSMQSYDQEGGPYLKATDDDPIYISLYSTLSLSFITCNRHDIKLWNALNGRLSRVYRGLSDSPITALCFDSRERKLFVGDKGGKIRVYNALTGAYMKSLTPHTEEIVFLQYLGENRELISAGSDRKVRVHDEKPIEEQIVKLELTLDHGLEILAVSVNVSQSLISVASSDSQISVWNMENGIKDEISKTWNEGITALTFLEPFPLVLAGDEAANLTAYHTRPSHIKGELAFAFNTNNGNYSNEEIVGAVSTLTWDEATQTLLIGNIHGQILAYSLRELIDAVVVQVDALSMEQHTKARLGLSSTVGSGLTTPSSRTLPSPTNEVYHSKTTMRPPMSMRHRKQPLTFNEIMGASPYINQSMIDACIALKPLFVIQAHSNAISSLTLTQRPNAIVSTARMHQVKLWGFDGQLQGVMDSQQALAASYEISNDTASNAIATTVTVDGVEQPVSWNFVVDVSEKEQTESELSERVLKDLETMQQQPSATSTDNANHSESEDELINRRTSRADSTARRKNHLEAERWLPMSWQQAVQDDDANQSVTDTNSDEDALVRMAIIQEDEDKIDEQEMQDIVTQGTTSRRATVEDSKSTTLMVSPQASFLLPPIADEALDGELLPRVSESSLPLIASSFTDSEMAEEEEKSSISWAPTILPPIRRRDSASSQAPQSQTPSQTMSSKSSTKSMSNLRRTAAATAAKKKFAYPKTVDQVPSQSNFTLGLEDGVTGIKLSAAQLQAAKQLQQALRAIDDS